MKNEAQSTGDQQVQTRRHHQHNERIAPVLEDDVTINYWPIRTAERAQHFELLVSVQVGGQRVEWTMRMKPETSAEIVINGRKLVLQALEEAVCVEGRANSEHLGRIEVSRNERA